MNTTTQTNSVSSDSIDCIIDRMIELNISQSELARRMKVSSPYVSKVLNHDTNLSFGTASKLATALGLEFSPVLHLSSIHSKGADPFTPLTSAV
jgi:transcriptional regulator with XRE-family HTH domain